MRSLSQGSNPFELKVVALVMAFGLAFYLLAAPLSLQLAVGSPSTSTISADQCPPCTCECLSDSESMLLPDCEKVDPASKEDLDMNSIELLSEELKLQESVAEESQIQADSALIDAKKLASQYQKEAEKCNSGMETCEEAREKSEAVLVAQKTLSAVWEKRARELGWRDKAERQSIFSRIGLTGSTSEDGQADSFFRSHK